MKGAFKAVLAVVGVGALTWFLINADLPEIGRTLLEPGWLALLLPLPYLMVYLADTTGWRFAFKFLPSVTFGTLFRIRWAGEAVNNVVPSAYLGGEALKAYLLRKHGVPVSTSAPAAIISKTVQTLAQLAFIALAGLAFLWIDVAPPAFRTAMLIVLGMGTAIVIALFWIQRHGLFGVIFNRLDQLPFRLGRLEPPRAKLLELDGEISGFYRSRPTRFLLCFGFYLGGWLLDTIEILLASHLFGAPMNWAQALAIEAFVSVAKALAIFIPGALGVQESSIVFLCRMAGVPESLGFTYAILRRAREVFFALIGWKLLALEEGTFKGLARRLKTLRRAPTSCG